MLVRFGAVRFLYSSGSSKSPASPSSAISNTGINTRVALQNGGAVPRDADEKQ